MELVRRLAIAVVLLAAAWVGPDVRRHLMRAVTYDDAAPAASVRFPDVPPAAAALPGLPPADRVRVIVVDGLAAPNTSGMPAWRATCARGLTLAVDVGFPTVSLPVEVALWTGLTQQQSGIVFRSSSPPRPLVPPLADGIPAKVAGSIAIAENHGWIARSLGFATALPLADPADPRKDAAPDAWRGEWLDRARAAVASDARLVFVHVLAVDTAGHRSGRASLPYAIAAGLADSYVGALVGEAPDARWFLLSDHGHLDGGGHGGKERELRQVQACIAGPDVPRGSGGPVHVVDLARAIADSTGVALAARSPGRPLGVALAAPFAGDAAVPALALGTGALALFVLALGAAVSYLAARRWWQLPWWFVIGCVALVAIRGLPTLSMAMVYAPSGHAMAITWLPCLLFALFATYAGRAHVARTVIAQLALPAGALAAALTASGAWHTIAGAPIAPVVPHYTAALSAILLLTAQGCAAVALAVLGTCGRAAFDRRAPRESAHTPPAAG